MTGLSPSHIQNIQIEGARTCIGQRTYVHLPTDVRASANGRT